jgi:hypothetical protein
MATAKWRQQLKHNPLLEAWDVMGHDIEPEPLGHMDLRSLDALVPPGYVYIEQELRILRAAILRQIDQIPDRWVELIDAKIAEGCRPAPMRTVSPGSEHSYQAFVDGDIDAEPPGLIKEVSHELSR